jgi:CTP synthase
VVIPGGFGVRGIEGKIGAARYARERSIPILGLCLGLQCMTIEVARHLADLDGANSLEFDPEAAHPVIATMADQEDIVAGKGDMGGSMRLGSYPAALVEGSIVAEAYGSTSVDERHRHRYEVNNAYRDALTKAGLRISGTSPDGRLVEFIELDRELHPFFVATQAHPELKSRPTRSHPLFSAFVGAALEYHSADLLPVDLEAGANGVAARAAAVS